MNGRESRITRLVFSEASYRDEIMSKIKKSKPIIGTKVEVESKKYEITTGGLDKLNRRIIKFKQKIKDEYCYK